MNLIWAGVYSVYKIVGSDVPSGSIVTLRFGMAAVCFLVAWPWLPGATPRGADLLKTCLLGLVVYVVGQRLQVYGNQLGTAGNSAVLMALEPLVASFAAGIFLKEYIGPRRMIGFAMGLIGVALLNEVWRPGFHWGGLQASVIFVSSFFCEAAYSVVGKPIIARASVMKMLAISLLIGTVANLLIDGGTTFSVAKTLPLTSWGLLGGLALFSTVIGYTVWFVIIRDCPVNVAALTIFAQAVFGVFLAAMWVGERLHWGHFWGTVTIAAGLVIGLSRQVKAT